ncbi:alpha/beta fold hydrolase [Pengzhenrongella frigida]|uniref:Alpha/beta hydrolase n=1 Tax=Pengzhenrongella frigida TaxID=1259133 RepID=A0A4Q5MWL1_9MICO|nr:alpha/beta hydrolase [Cellulomonas sp. HLT2-17]RYV49945.1 alpha/beta hydrolase [Cellulomonas sp. HLT2-17]
MDQHAVVRRVELSTGLALAYVCVGPRSATPVVLLHAWGESRGSFDRLLPLLPSTLRALALDQRGHGDAERPKAGYSLTGFAEDVVAFMDAVGLASAVLLGSSSGGYVAQQVAVTHPDRVAGLVLVGSPRSLQGRPSFADEVDQLSDPVGAGWVRASLAWFPRFHEVPQSYLDARVQDGARIPAHVWRETFYGLCDAAPPTGAATITAPTLIIWGDRDEMLGREQEEDLAAAIPGSSLVVYEETGHLVLWEQPERVARDLTAFVESLSQRRS